MAQGEGPVSPEQGRQIVVSPSLPAGGREDRVGARTACAHLNTEQRDRQPHTHGGGSGGQRDGRTAWRYGGPEGSGPVVWCVPDGMTSEKQLTVDTENNRNRTHM